MTKERDYFKTFCKVSKALGTTLSKEKLLDLIVTSAVETMDAKAACLFLSDAKTDTFVTVAQTGLSENYLHSTPQRAKKIVEAILKGGHLYFKDAATDPRIENHEEKKAEGIASILDVPVMVKDRAIGVMALYTGEPREFTEAEVQFLSALADQGGMAIEQARLVRRIRQNALLFHDMASNINSSLEIEKILSNLTDDMCKTLGMRGVAIRLLDEDSGELQLVASCGLSESFLEKGRAPSTPSAIQALKGETVVIEDATTDSRVQYREEIQKEGLASMVVTPIKSREKIIGTLRLYSEVKRAFPEDFLTLIKALAHQGALAIQNASMFLKLQEDKENLEKDIWSHRSWF